jgi:predicted Zn-dependent protease
LNAAERDLLEDAEDAARLVAGLLRRGQGGEAFRERRHVTTWSASEAGLLQPSLTEERGTAIRVRRGRESLLVARVGDGPEALREAVREASRRAGGSPFLKRRQERADRDASRPPDPGEEERTQAVASAIARAIPDPRGLTLSLAVSRVVVTRAVITPRSFFPCGTAVRLEAGGVIGRAEARRPFAFQASGSWAAAAEALSRSLQEAVRPMPSLAPPEGLADVVFSPSASAVFWHEAVGHPLEAEGGERASVLGRVPRAAVAPPGLTVVDDPTRPDLPGAFLHDDEGVAAQAVTLVEDGRIVGVLTDQRTAGPESNGHGRCSDFRRPPRPRLSNLVVPPGTASPEELFDLCGNGLWVKEIVAGSADPESGRFLLVAESAQIIRKGRPGATLSRFVLTGDLLQALRHLAPERGTTSPPSPGLGLCVKGGDPLPVGGAAPAILVRGLRVRTARA